MVNIQLPDGNVIQVPEGSTVGQVAEKIGPGLAKAAVGGRINGDRVDLSFQIDQDTSLEVITLKDEEGLDTLRHSCAHVMAQAICALWPETKLVYGPTVTDGFYYDIDLDEPIRPTDFERIEAEMDRIVKADYPIVRYEMSREEALKKLEGDQYKIDNVNRAQGDVISFYSQGEDFEDLCR